MLNLYIKSSSIVLEIGCGRGAWTKLMLEAQKIYCLDALSAEHNGFNEYVGLHDHLFYYQVTDFSLNMIPDNSLDYVFSYDVLCHVSNEGIEEYAKNMFHKMKSGAIAFWMVADYKKYNSFVDNIENINNQNTLSCLIFLGGKRGRIINLFLKHLFHKINLWQKNRYSIGKLDLNEDNIVRAGRWYNMGREKLVNLLKEVGYEIISEDMELDFRSPIVYFKKP